MDENFLAELNHNT